MTSLLYILGYHKCLQNFDPPAYLKIFAIHGANINEKTLMQPNIYFFSLIPLKTNFHSDIV